MTPGAGEVQAGMILKRCLFWLQIALRIRLWSQRVLSPSVWSSRLWCGGGSSLSASLACVRRRKPWSSAVSGCHSVPSGAGEKPWGQRHPREAFVVPDSSASGLCHRERHGGWAAGHRGAQHHPHPVPKPGHASAFSMHQNPTKPPAKSREVRRLLLAADKAV